MGSMRVSTTAMTQLHVMCAHTLYYEVVCAHALSEMRTGVRVRVL